MFKIPRPRTKVWPNRLYSRPVELRRKSGGRKSVFYSTESEPTEQIGLSSPSQCFGAIAAALQTLFRVCSVYDANDAESDRYQSMTYVYTTWTVLVKCPSSRRLVHPSLLRRDVSRIAYIGTIVVPYVRNDFYPGGKNRDF